MLDNIIKKVLDTACGILHLRLSEKTVSSLVQFVKFGLVGVSNTLISYGLNVLVLFLMKPLALSWDYIVGNMVAFLLSVLWSFYWNSKYVFTVGDGEKRNPLKALLRTYIAYGSTGIILTNILSTLWIRLGISKFIAPLINLVICVPLNFIINKLWAFQTKQDNRS